MSLEGLGAAAELQRRVVTGGAVGPWEEGGNVGHGG